MSNQNEQINNQPPNYNNQMPINQNEEQSYMKQIKDFLNSTPLTVTVLIDLNIFFLFINLFISYTGLISVLLRSFFIFFFWSPLGKKVENSSGTGRYMLLLMINVLAFTIPYILIFNHFHVLSESIYNFALFETLLIALSNKDKHILVINKKIPCKFIIYGIPFISLFILHQTFGMVIAVIYALLYHKYFSTKIHFSDEYIIQSWENNCIFKLLMKNRRYVKLNDQFIPIINNNANVNPINYAFNNPIQSQPINIQNNNYQYYNNFNNNQVYSKVYPVINNQFINHNIQNQKFENEIKNKENPNIKYNKNSNEVHNDEDDYPNIKNKPNSDEINADDEYPNIQNKPNSYEINANDEYPNIQNKPNSYEINNNNEYPNIQNKPNSYEVNNNNEYPNIQNKPNSYEVNNGKAIYPNIQNKPNSYEVNKEYKPKFITPGVMDINYTPQ